MRNKLHSEQVAARYKLRGEILGTMLEAKIFKHSTQHNLKHNY